MSDRKVTDQLERVCWLKVSAATVYDWIGHFGKLAADWVG
jgi:hypothetical protein